MHYYLDTNAYIDILERNPAGLSAFGRFFSSDNVLHISEETLFELVWPGTYDAVRREQTISTILEVPSRHFLPKHEELLEHERSRLEAGEFPPGALFQDFEKLEVVHDVIKRTLRDELTSAEKAVLEDRRLKREQNHLPWIANVREANRGLPPLANLGDAIGKLDPQQTLEAIVHQPVSPAATQRFIRENAGYPVLSLHYKILCYKTYRALDGRPTPFRKDLLPDVAHITEAVYANVFVSGDATIQKEARELLAASQRVQSTAVFRDVVSRS